MLINITNPFKVAAVTATVFAALALAGTAWQVLAGPVQPVQANHGGPSHTGQVNLSLHYDGINSNGPGNVPTQINRTGNTNQRCNAGLNVSTNGNGYANYLRCPTGSLTAQVFMGDVDRGPSSYIYFLADPQQTDGNVGENVDKSFHFVLTPKKGTIRVHLNRNWSGVNVSVFNGNCDGSATKQTDGNGNVRFDNCRAGENRTIQVENRVTKDGRVYDPYGDNGNSIDQNQTIFLGHNDDKTVNFTYRPRGDINVQVKPKFGNVGVSVPGGGCDGADTKQTDTNGRANFTNCKPDNNRAVSVDGSLNRNQAPWVPDSVTKNVSLGYDETKNPEFRYRVNCTPAGEDGFQYILRPPADCDGTRQDQDGARIEFIMHRPSNERSSTVAYVPNQFVVASSRPEVQFGLRGGFWNTGGRANGGDHEDISGNNNNDAWVGNVPRMFGYDSPFYYEVYQVSTLDPQDGQLLGVINPRDRNVFPTVDHDPFRNTNCPTPSGAASDCWRNFRIDTAGGPITQNGASQQYYNSYGVPLNDPQTISPTFKKVEDSQRFRSGAHPNLNGLYVFLIKVVNFQDIDQGYVDDYTKLGQRLTSPNGRVGRVPLSGGSNNVERINCPQPDANNVDCPDYLSFAASGRNPSSRFPGNPGQTHANVAAPGIQGQFFANGYYLRAPESIGGEGRQYLASSPTNISYNLRWGPYLGVSTTDNFNEIYGSQNDSLRFSAGGSGCRNDNYSNSIGFQADEASTLLSRGSVAWGGSTGNPQFRFSNIDYGAQNTEVPSNRVRANSTNPGGIGTTEFSEYALSDNWNEKIWTPTLDNPSEFISLRSPEQRWLNYEYDLGRIFLRNWGDSNNIYQGGTPLTTGQQPNCHRPIGLNPYTSQSIGAFDISAPWGYTPQAPQGGNAGLNDGGRYLYNGADNASTPTTVEADLSFIESQALPVTPQASRPTQWTAQVYNIGETAKPIGTAILSQSSSSSSQNRGQFYANQVSLDTRSLAANTLYAWRICATGGDANRIGTAPGWPERGNRDWNCSNPSTFQVNKGPVASLPAIPATDPRYRCAEQSMTLNDLEGHSVMPAFSASWNDGNGLKTVTTKRYTGGWKPSGSSFTTSSVMVDTLNGATISQSKTLAEYLRDDVPKNVRVTLSGWGIDGLGASDMSDTSRPLSDVSFQKTVDQNIFFRIADSKRGDAATITYATPPNFGKPPAKKEFLDPATGQPFNSTGTVSDGQTVDVRLTLQNTGETPMKSLKLVDYFGSVRDFEDPSNFRMTLNGTNIPITDAQPTKSQVKSNHDDNDTSTPNDLANTRDDGQVSYRIDYGNLGATSTGTLAALRKTQLEPGDTLTFTFTIKANRNRTLAPDRSDVDNGNFNRSQGVGSTASPQPTPAADPGGGSVDIGDAHTYARYQSDFCDPTNLTSQNLDFNPGDVVAPALYAQRGSVFSNSNITGYSSGATYTVTAAGNIIKFASSDTTNGSLEGYDATSRQRTGCTINSPAGGLDWRRAMIDNIATLKAGATTTIGPVAPGGTIALGSGGVFQSAGDLTLTGNTFSGVGTIIVNGNLRITGNLGYATPQASVGLIVLGNVEFGDSVSQAVGSYYVSDVDYANPPVLDSNGCPKLSVSKGTVKTTKVPLQLKIDGLMVARYFDFGRYYATPQNTATSTLAEQVYYDGRVLNTAQTPPGFTTFARNTSWYEVTPGQ